MQEIIVFILLAVVAAMAAYILLEMGSSQGSLTKKQIGMMQRILQADAILLLLELVDAEAFQDADAYLVPGAGKVLRMLAYLSAYGIIGHDILRKAWQGIKNLRGFDENFLMAVATLGAMAIAVYENGDYLEAVAVMLFYQIGEWFQGYAVGKSRRDISSLMDIRPDYANIEVAGRLEQVDPDEVPIGSMIVVQPGERVPIDGILMEGRSSLNTVALTGESLPREVEPGQEIISGCINMTGLLKIRTTKEFGESTASKILELVENASSRKSKSEDFIAKFAKVYTPAVCYAALAIAILPPVLGLLVLQVPPEWDVWIYRGLTFLVISCPCALVISIPLSFFAGIGGASREGVLVKGSTYLEALAKVDTLVFDKTGTLTQGSFQVSGIHHSSMPQDRLLEYAALAESSSSHPISKSLQQAYGKEIDRSRVQQVQELGGEGVQALVDGLQVAAGNGKLMTRLGIDFQECHTTGTVVHLAIDGAYAGHIVISDVIKPHAGIALSQLKKLGMAHLVMLTGDDKRVAEQVAGELGLTEVHSQLLPGDKVDKVEDLLAQKQGQGKLAFVGDGINDAPVLSRADIGIAMGAMGSDAAIEAADVVLMDDDPVKIPQAIRIARKCMGIVYQNIVLAISVKLVCLILGAVGIGNMYLAIFADVGVMLLAVMNAIRCLTVPKAMA